MERKDSKGSQDSWDQLAKQERGVQQDLLELQDQLDLLASRDSQAE
jgi:hypothetical protein